jgi:hypothetical protein
MHYATVNIRLFPAGEATVQDDMFRHICAIFSSDFELQLLHHIISINFQVSLVDPAVCYTQYMHAEWIHSVYMKIYAKHVIQ